MGHLTSLYFCERLLHMRTFFYKTLQLSFCLQGKNTLVQWQLGHVQDLVYVNVMMHIWRKFLRWNKEQILLTHISCIFCSPPVSVFHSRTQLTLKFAARDSNSRNQGFWLRFPGQWKPGVRSLCHLLDVLFQSPTKEVKKDKKSMLGRQAEPWWINPQCPFPLKSLECQRIKRV